MKKQAYKILGAALVCSMALYGAALAERPELGALTYEAGAAEMVKQATEQPTKDVVLGNLLAKGNYPKTGAQTTPEAEEVTIDLDKVIMTALENNRAIKISEYEYREAEASVREAAAKKNPSVSLSVNAARGANRSQQFGYLVAESYKDGVTVSWPLWTGGNVEGAIARARANRGAKEEALYLQEADTKLSAISSYYQYLKTIWLSDVAKESQDNLAGHLKNVEQQYNAGIVAKLDVLSSNVSLANAKQSYITAENAKQLAEANLNNVMRLPLDTKLTPSTTEFPEPEFTITMEEALAMADAYRWEIAQAQYSLKASQGDLRSAKSGYLPTLAIGGGLNWEDTKFPGFKNRTWNIAATLSWSLFDGGATDAKILSANNAIKAAEETLAKTRETIALEVRQDYLNVVAAKEKIRATEAAVEQAEEAFKIASIRYKSGVGINLDVLDAQLNLNNAKTNHISALYDYNVGLATLEKALGFPAVIHEGVVTPLATNAEKPATSDETK